MPRRSTEVKTELKRLTLRHTWTTTMSSSEYRDTVQVAYQRDGVVGHGEGALSFLAAKTSREHDLTHFRLARAVNAYLCDYPFLSHPSTPNS